MQNKNKEFLEKLLTLFEEYEAEITFKELNEYSQGYTQGKMVIENKNWEVLTRNRSR